jgi:hypothetical protein
MTLHEETFLRDFNKKSPQEALRASPVVGACAPEDGATIKVFDGQAYELVGTVPYTRRDGTATELRQWRGYCADCNAEFIFSSPISASKFSPNRRCTKHKRPGARVNSGKARS